MKTKTIKDNIVRENKRIDILQKHNHYFLACLVDLGTPNYVRHIEDLTEIEYENKIEANNKEIEVCVKNISDLKQKLVLSV